MGEVYKMTIAGCERELPICPISDTLDIAGFVMFGDVEITEKTAKALMEKCPEHDIIIIWRGLRHSAGLRDGAYRLPSVRCCT